MIKGFFQERKKRKQAVHSASLLFRKEYPEERLFSCIGNVKYSEPDRYIVEVFYGLRKPPQVRFYAVDKIDGKVYQVQDSKYTPTYCK
jgi:hypothetical protein